MFNRLKSLTLATLVLSLTLPLLTNSVKVDLPRADAQTPAENPKTEPKILQRFR